MKKTKIGINFHNIILCYLKYSTLNLYSHKINRETDINDMLFPRDRLGSR